MYVYMHAAVTYSQSVYGAALSALCCLWNAIHILVAFIHIGGLQHCLSCARPPVSQPPLFLPQDVGDQRAISPFKQQHNMGH